MLLSLSLVITTDAVAMDYHGPLNNNTADCTTVVILLGNRRWPCGLGMNRQFT